MGAKDAKREHECQVSELMKQNTSNETIKTLSETITSNPFSQNSDSSDELTANKWPPVSINIIDSDNIHVCMCSQMLYENKVNDNSVEGSICPECQNIIKKQSVGPRYRLISKRLMLSNNIIVNRIDTQHLSTYFEVSLKRQDPYTPESAESHSPCPELSSSTTTSSNSRSPAIDCRQFLTPDVEESISDTHNVSNLAIDNNMGYLITSKEMGASNKYGGDIKNQKRGVISPVQLKSRLEDLQRKSSRNLKLENEGDSETAGHSDVEDVDEICQSTNSSVRQYPSTCLPKCCNIH